jgi:hypothetical protein
VYLLSHLFLGGPAPVAATCSIALPCPPEATVVLENGDTDGDRQRSLTDAVHLLNWLFLEGAPPAETCSCKPGAGCEPPCEPPDLCLPAASEPLTFTCTSALATCEDVRAVYNFLTERVDPSCNPAVGCHVVLGHCGIGLGGCWYAVSRTVKQEYLDALAERFLELGGLRECVSGVCDCAPPPPSASCVEGRCLADR